MEIRTINGQRATDRRGAAQYLQRSHQTIKLLASKRDDNGFPNPVDVETAGRGVRVRDGEAQGREWYALADLDNFRDTYLAAAEATGQARVRNVQLDGDPDELLDGQQIAAELQIEYATWRSWVRDAVKKWGAGEQAYIPRHDDEEPARRGITRKWRRATIQTFVDNRQGPNPSPGRPKATTAA